MEWAPIIIAALGSGAVASVTTALITGLFSRKKLAAEVAKLSAEAEAIACKADAEIQKIRAEASATDISAAVTAFTARNGSPGNREAGRIDRTTHRRE